MDIISKKSYEKFPIRFNYSNNLTTLETVASIVLTCVNTATGVDTSGTIISSSSIASPDVMVVLMAGAVGDRHLLTCKATTNLTTVYEKEVIINIVDSTEGSFTKQPYETYIISMDFTNVLESGDTLASQNLTAIRKSDATSATTTVITSSGIDGGKLSVLVKAGTNGETYQLTGKVITILSYQYQMDVLMQVVEF